MTNQLSNPVTVMLYKPSMLKLITMKLAHSHGILWGSFTSVWWLQKVCKPQPPPGGGGGLPREGGAHF